MIPAKFISDCANAKIELGRASVEVMAGGETLHGEGSAFLRFLPSECVVVSVELPEQVNDLRLLSGPLKLRFGEQKQSVPVIAIKTSGLLAAPLRADLVPSGGRFVFYRDGRVRLRKLVFHVLNFPEFYSIGKGAQGTDVFHQQDGAGTRLGRAILTDSDWTIELCALRQTSELVKQLRAEGGSAITHVGTLRRTNGRSFSIREADRALAGLHDFLSFARGQWTSIFGLVGTDIAGKTVYEDWSIRLSAPWSQPLRWFDAHHGQMLGSVYSGFSGLRHDNHLGRAVSQAIYWYLRSNRSGDGPGVDGGLLLSQAALERLALGYLRKQGLSERGPAGELIGRALTSLSIPTGIPKETPNLRAAKRRQGWKTAPHAIVDVRNELVHPNNRLKVQLRPLLFESWQLAQWYVELIILRLSGYDGEYSNRLKRRWVGQTEPVPWAPRK